MAKITAAEVNKLRKTTGSGMMDCKKALVEADGDFDKAIEELRKKGQKVAAKRSDKEANEGVIIAQTTDDGKFGTILTINCETDFVAKNAEFISFVQTISDVSIKQKPEDIEKLKELGFDDNTSIHDKIIEQTGKIGEKVSLSNYEIIKAETVVPYIHPGNKLAALVGLNKAGDNVSEAGKQIAMQIAAMNPIALDEDSVSQETKDQEMKIGRDQAIEEGKPENIIDKIALGKMSKFLKENTLVNQKFIKDNKKTVAQYLKETDKELKIVDYKRKVLG